MWNKKGVVEAAILTYIIVGMFLLFVPNPLSSAVGVGVRPNKTVQTEKVELLTDKAGNPIKTSDGAYLVKHSVSDNDIQQRVGFFEWLRSLPILVLFLMGAGVVFPGISFFLQRIYSSLKTETKKIVVSVDKAMDKLQDSNVKQSIYDEMSKTQDTSTKKLVDKIQGKQ